MDVYRTLLWIHVLAAALVMGLLAALLMLPGRIPRDACEKEVTRHTLRFLDRSNNALLVPALVLLFLTGLGMSVGPFAPRPLFGPEGNWIVVGMGLWVLLSAVVGGGMVGLVKEMRSLLDRDADTAARMATLWRQFRWGLAAGAVVAVVTIAVMVYQPTF